MHRAAARRNRRCRIPLYPRSPSDELLLGGRAGRCAVHHRAVTAFDMAHYLSIFLGSPGDVLEERKAAKEVVAELHDHPLLRDKITIRLRGWTRRSPLEGTTDPQRAVVKYVGRPSENDLTVIILSGRLGTPMGQLKPDGAPY